MFKKGIHLEGDPDNPDDVAAAARCLFDLISSSQIDKVRQLLSEAARQPLKLNNSLYQGWEEIAHLWEQHAL